MRSSVTHFPHTHSTVGLPCMLPFFDDPAHSPISSHAITARAPPPGHTHRSPHILDMFLLHVRKLSFIPYRSIVELGLHISMFFLRLASFLPRPSRSSFLSLANRSLYLLYDNTPVPGPIIYDTLSLPWLRSLIRRTMMGYIALLKREGPWHAIDLNGDTVYRSMRCCTRIVAINRQHCLSVSLASPYSSVNCARIRASLNPGLSDQVFGQNLGTLENRIADRLLPHQAPAQFCQRFR